MERVNCIDKYPCCWRGVWVSGIDPSGPTFSLPSSSKTVSTKPGNSLRYPRNPPRRCSGTTLSRDSLMTALNVRYVRTTPMLSGIFWFSRFHTRQGMMALTSATARSFHIALSPSESGIRLTSMFVR